MLPVCCAAVPAVLPVCCVVVCAVLPVCCVARVLCYPCAVLPVCAVAERAVLPVCCAPCIVTAGTLMCSPPHSAAGPHFAAVNSNNEIIVTDFHNHSVKVRSACPL